MLPGDNSRDEVPFSLLLFVINFSFRDAKVAIKVERAKKKPHFEKIIVRGQIFGIFFLPLPHENQLIT
jgi:hypothetical protein